MQPHELDAEFTRLFEDHYEAVRTYALRRIPPDGVADVVQETFLVAWRRPRDVPRNARPWLLAVARRVILREWRSSGRRDALVTRVASATPSGADIRSAEVSDSPLLASLDRLRPNDREVLALVYWDGLTAAEAAVVLGCSQATVRVRLHRARRRLSQLVEAGDISVADHATFYFEEAV
jgi:RNA polymerase sigma-70 factor (ECF subfamily)